MLSITSFSGNFYFLSNFYPVRIVYEFEEYPSVEHAYQAAKTLDKDYRILIAKAETAAKAKKIGMVVPLKENWEAEKIAVMRALLRSKFSNPKLKKLLLYTKSYKLVEGNWWGDTFWGVDMQGKGSNWLGKLLMELREELRNDNV